MPSVKAADTLWDARGGHDPTVAATSPQQSRSHAPHNGKRGDKKRAAIPALKVAPLPTLISIRFKTLAKASVNFTTTTPTRLAGVLHPLLGRKTN
jgi:hypothetical protein